MADLKAGTTVGGAMVWTQGNFPLFPSGNTLLYRDYTVYTTNDKPQAVDNDFVSKAQGGTFEKTITMKGSVSSATMMQLQGTAVGTQYALTDSAGALTGSNYQIYAQGDQFKFRAPNTVAAGLIDVLIWTNPTKRFDLSGNLYVSGSVYNLYDSTGGIFYSPKNKPVAADVGLGNVTNDAQLKIASNLSDVANIDTTRTNISAAKSGANSDITSLAALTSITKGLTLSSTLTVSGATTVNNTLNVTQASTFNSTVGITGNTTIGGNTYISGLATVAGTLGVTGRTNLTGLTINHTTANWLDITGAYSPTTNQYMTNGIRIWNRDNRLVDLYNFESVGNYSALTVHVYNSANSNEAGAYYEFRNSGLFIAPAISSNTTIAAGADIRARGSMYVGNGDTRMAQDGNIWGTRWNSSGEWLYDWMNRTYLNDIFLGGQQWWNTPVGPNTRKDWALGGGSVCTGYTQTDEGSYHIWIDGMFYRQIWKRYANGSQAIIAST